MVDQLWFTLVSEASVNWAAAAFAAAVFVPVRYPRRNSYENGAIFLFDTLIGILTLIASFYLRKLGT